MINPAANPYAAHLENRNPFEVIAATPGKLQQLSAKLGAEGMNRSLAPGKWTAREILCHLADCEVAFAFRIRQTLAEDNHVVQPFDQDKWARTYAAYQVPQALEAFWALRQWNADLVRSVTPQALTKPLSHPERGQLTFKTLIETMAGHDLNHLAQLETIASRTSAQAR
jgi:hypothetical protein